MTDTANAHRTTAELHEDLAYCKIQMEGRDSRARWSTVCPVHADMPGVWENVIEGIKAELLRRAPQFKVGDKIVHERFGPGRIVEVSAIAAASDEENEYTVRLRSDRYPVTLGEHGLRAA